MPQGETTTMDTNWMPAFAAGTLGSVGAWLISWRIASARSEGRTEGDEKRADELRAADGKRSDELRLADAKRADDLRSDLRELKEDWRSGIERVQVLSDNITRLQSAQNVVNGMTAKALESVNEKLDRHDGMLADHTATIRLLVDKVMTAK